MSNLPKELKVGPGGVNCPCCFYVPSKHRNTEMKKARRKAIRTARRKANTNAIKFELANMEK